jgi:hypothetical protein
MQWGIAIDQCMRSGVINNRLKTIQAMGRGTGITEKRQTYSSTLIDCVCRPMKKTCSMYEKVRGKYTHTQDKIKTVIYFIFCCT